MVLAHVLQYDLAIEVSISTTMLVCPFDIQIGCTRILNIVRTTHQILLELEYVRDKNITLDYYLSLGFSGAKYSMYYAYSYYPARCLDYLSLQQLRYYFPIIIFILTHPVNFLCGGGGGGTGVPVESHDFRQNVDRLFTWVRSENWTISRSERCKPNKVIG